MRITEDCDTLLHDIIENCDVRPVFQPIVSLRTGTTVAYEALARGPAGTPLESPDALFALAAATGRTAELDWTCRIAALRAALGAGLTCRLPLFVNAEPATVRTPPPAALRRDLIAAAQRLRIVVELTERKLISDPDGLLLAVRDIRARGMLIALDDIGADPASLQAMRAIAPEVLKVDRSVVQHCKTPTSLDVIAAVRAQARRTGAVMVAEGIENTHHLRAALWLGASLGQGWLFGHPGPLPVWFSDGGPAETAPDPAATLRALDRVQYRPEPPRLLNWPSPCRCHETLARHTA
ncbi:hypothetical protein Cs7R123_51180 [Catellatospora sp. TT07R-123]|uniref:EAL domain-containing protein n=1 Tax=Catellatospora sp. TT07R-123 TaxID=2733863 RepID=UPI001B14A3B4|nr:EAL domain-containing protein [Catellatospora sp. TT07R-123]GHJ47776.1 hypothetical protein Cs7R123_51180 [Catellatospora sp. TT07R-123]